MAGQDNLNNILHLYDPLEGRVTRKYIPESSKQVYNRFVFWGTNPVNHSKVKLLFSAVIN